MYDSKPCLKKKKKTWLKVKLKNQGCIAKIQKAQTVGKETIISQYIISKSL